MTGVVAIAIALLVRVEPLGNRAGDNGHARGCLQIHTEMVKECNRLIAVNHIPHQKFAYKDRDSRQKSYEMAEIYLTWAAERHRISDPRLLAYRWNSPATGHVSWRYRQKVRDAYNAFLTGST